jgi:hypothetical protein
MMQAGRRERLATFLQEASTMFKNYLLTALRSYYIGKKIGNRS